jgi:predicted RNase H-like HicB family nuclease
VTDLRYTVLLEPEDEGGFHAFVPALPGLHTYGSTRDEAVERATEAAEAYLEDVLEQGETLPTERFEETQITVTT